MEENLNPKNIKPIEDTKTRLDNLKALLDKTAEDAELKLNEEQETNDVQLPVNKSLQYDERLTREQLQFIELYLPMKLNVTEICEHIGISRQCYYKWLNENETFKTFMDDYRQYLQDKSEEVLLQALEGGDVKVAMFVLKTLGKKRGYGDSVDITSNGNTLGTIINILPPKQDEPHN